MIRTIETSYGPVDAKALENLQNSFDTTRLFNAVDSIDRIRSRMDEVRQDLLDLHSMAHEVINEDYGSNRPVREETIWELADNLSGELLEFIDELEKARSTLDPLDTLMPTEEWDQGQDDIENKI